MNKKLRWSLGSVVAVGALGAAVLLPATGASAADATTPTVSFACPDNTDTIQVPFAFDADNNPELAGVVCVETGTTVLDSLNVTPGWTAQVKSDGSNNRTEVRFAESGSRDRVELRYEAGRTEIKN